MKRFLHLLWLMLALPALAMAQYGSLSGIIAEKNSNAPLLGANIILLGTNLGAISSLDGTYKINNIPVGTYVIRVSFVGFKSTETEVEIIAGSNVLNASLNEDLAGLDEVVVTGIASATSKARAEVAVSSVDAEKLLEKNNYQDVSQLLNGKVAGVNVQLSSGNVASGVRFNMRSTTGLNGIGHPIVYLDGIRIDAEPLQLITVGGQQISFLASLTPEDIASVEVLKGPAGAALYGTSGSDGVILITTKRGKLAGAERPFQVNHKTVIGTNTQFQKYDRFTASTPDAANGIFRTGDIQQHNLSVSGGSTKTRYFTSYDTRMEEGHTRNNKAVRNSFRANFETFPIENLSLRVNTNYNRNDVNRPYNDDNMYGYLTNTLITSQPWTFADSLSIESIINWQRNARFFGVVETEYEPLKNLKLKASIGFDGSDIRNDSSFPSNLFYSGQINGERTIVNRRNEQYTYDFNARYSYNIFPDLNATTIIGSQAFSRKRDFSFVVKQNFSTELITNIGAGSNFIVADEGLFHGREAGIFAQQELSYKNYLFTTFGGRQDFATSIGNDAPSIFYPKASMAIRIDELAAFEGAINFLKLRIAYGETGQLPDNTAKSSLRWAARPSGYGSGAVIDFVGNPEIKPERIKELEAGFELGVFNDRLFVDVTGYRQKVDDSIIEFINPPSSGRTASGVPFNIGAASGWGIESSLGIKAINQTNLGLSFNLIWNFQKHEVDDLGDAQPIFAGINVIKEGLPRSTFYTWSTRATFNDDGSYAGPELTSTDADGDGVPDRLNFGQPTPKHNGSFTLNLLVLRNLTVSGLLDWQLGNKVLNLSKIFQRRFGTDYKRNVALVQIGAATAESVGLENENIAPLTVGSTAYKAAAETVAKTEFQFENLTLHGNVIEDADFIKLREVSIRYDFTNLLRKANLSRFVRSASFTLAGRNLWMSTKYSGMDPEVNFVGANSTLRATDLATLPQPRVIYGTFSIGL